MLKKDIEITLLSKEEVEGKSKVLQKIGAGCGEAYWTRTPSHFSHWHGALEFDVNSSGALGNWDVSYGHGVRPVLKSDNLKELIKECKVTLENGIQIIEYGNFPHLLENVKINDLSLLQSSNNEYILLSTKDYKMTLERFTEYDYNGQKVVEDKYCSYHPVKPIEWYVDEENNMLIAKDVLFRSPIAAPVDVNNDNYKGIFETSGLYNYLNNDFLKQLLASAEINRVITNKLDDLSSLEAKVGELKSQNESKREKANKLEALLKEEEQLQRGSAALDAKIAELTQSLNQKRKKL